MIKDYYKILQISRDSNSDQIKKAFRTLALQWHPDKNSSPDANSVFININEAYEIIGDVNKRETYNTLYDTYFVNQLSVTHTKNSEQQFEKYSEWQSEAVKKAYERAKMSFNDFTNFINNLAKEAAMGCQTIFMILLWISWGPVGLYYFGKGMYEMVLDMLEVGFKFGFIFMTLFFLISLTITVVGFFLLKSTSNK